MLDEATRAKIFDHYEKGQGSIQDIARVYRVSVDEVLEIIGESDMSSVDSIGDQIDPSEAGNAQLNYQGTKHHIPFTTD